MSTTTTPTTPLEFVRQYKEQLQLGVYLVLLTGLAVPLVGLFRRGWWADGGHVTRTLVLAVDSLGPSVGALQALLLGGVLTAVALMIVDRRKRVQGLLLAGSLALVTVGFSLQGFVPRVLRDVGTHVPWIVLGTGLALAAFVPRSVAQSLSRLDTPPSLEFRAAPRFLAWTTTVIVVTMWLEAHLMYPPLVQQLLEGAPLLEPGLYLGVETDKILLDTLTGGAFVGLTWLFVSYEATTSVVFVGPKGAGKTMGVYGAYLEYRQRRDEKTAVATAPSAGLATMQDEANAGRIVADGGSGARLFTWPIDETDYSDIQELSFDIQDGHVFPQTLTVSALDYPGEALSALSRVVDGEDPEHIEDVPKGALSRLHSHIRDADVVVFLVDLERALAPEETLGIGPYQRIIQAYRGQKQFLVAATKADLLADEYEERYREDPYMTANVDDFTTFVTEELSGRNGAVRALLSDTGVEALHPVYFMTEVHEGERLPVRTEEGLHPFGFVSLLDDLR